MVNMPLTHLLYVSTISPGVDPKGVMAIHADSQARNARRDVTGLLLYGRGNFMQLLEGEAVTVTDLYARIARDRRHRDVRTLYCGPTQRRLFPTWNMGLVVLDEKLTPVNRNRLEAVLDAANRPDAGTTTSGQKVLELLKDFRSQLAA
jgi:hypothetical protein